MTKTDLFALVAKISGFYLLVRALEALQYVGVTIISLSSIPADQQSGYLIASVFPVILLLAGAFALIKWSARIGILLGVDETPISLNNDVLGKETLLKIVYAGIGVFIVANAIPKFTQLIIMLTIQGTTGIGANTWVSFVGVGMQLFIGIFLFLKQRNLKLRPGKQ
ncbi:MAG TPA: hypothetical protein GXZ26_08065 [Firmicutes bacterium]|nr:hypothetical protein [Bacillota bacterium]